MTGTKTVEASDRSPSLHRIGRVGQGSGVRPAARVELADCQMRGTAPVPTAELADCQGHRAAPTDGAEL